MASLYQEPPQSHKLLKTILPRFNYLFFTLFAEYLSRLISNNQLEQIYKHTSHVESYMDS